MKTLTGRAIDAVTGAGVAQLGIALLAWDAKAPQPYRAGDLLGRDVALLAKLPLRRAASTTTDRAGHFTLDPGDSGGPHVVVALHGEKRPGGNAWVVGATASLRSSAEDGEEVILHVTQSARHRAGLDQPDARWASLAGGSTAPSRRAVKGSLASAYRASRDAVVAANAAQAPPRGFLGQLAVLSASERGGVASLAFDKKTGSFGVRQGGKRVRLRFGGVARATPDEGGPPGVVPTVRCGVEVDAGKRSFVLRIPEFTETLRAVQRPSAMRRELLKAACADRAKAAAAASSAAPSDSTTRPDGGPGGRTRRGRSHGHQ